MSRSVVRKLSVSTKSVTPGFRAAQDLLARVANISAAKPYIVSAGSSDGGTSRMLLERFTSARLLCIEPSAERIASAKVDGDLGGRLIQYEHGAVADHFAKGRTDGSLYDLVFSSGDGVPLARSHLARQPEGPVSLPELLERQLERIRPGGTLAMHLCDPYEQPIQRLLCDVAAELGVLEQLSAHDGAPLAPGAVSTALQPAALSDRLLGPLCASLDMWTTTYSLSLRGEEAAYELLRTGTGGHGSHSGGGDGGGGGGGVSSGGGGGGGGSGGSGRRTGSSSRSSESNHGSHHVPGASTLSAVLAALGGSDGSASEPARRFDAALRAKLLATFPPSKRGVTLIPQTHFFVVARRPSLLDVYSEYAAYHTHQLDKGWKS